MESSALPASRLQNTVHSVHQMTRKAWELLCQNEFFAVSLSLLLLECLFFYREIFLAQPRVSIGILYGVAPWSASPQGAPQSSWTSDTVFEFQAWRQFATESISHGVIPLWNPYNAAGEAFLGNLGSAVFSPFSLPYYVLPYGAAETIAIVAKLYVAGIGTYFLVRGFRLSRFGAFVSSIIFTFSGFLAVWLDYSITSSAVLLPTLFLATHRFYEKQSAKRFAALTLIICIQVFGGHIEVTVFSLIAASLFFIYLLMIDLFQYRTAQAFVRSVKVSCLAIACVLTGLGLSGIQLFPFVDYLLHSYIWAIRGSHGGGLPWPNVISLLMPNFWGTQSGYYWDFPEANGGYVGPIALTLAVIGLVTSLRKRIAAFFTFLGIISMSVVYSFPYVSVYAIFHNSLLTIPANGRVLLIFAFCMAILAGFGVDHIGKLRSLEVIVASGIAAGMVLVALSGVLFLLSVSAFIHWIPNDIATTYVVCVGFVLFSGSVVVTLTVCLLLRSMKRATVASNCLRLFLIFLIVVSLFSLTINYNITNTTDRYPPAPALAYLQRDTGLYRVLTAGWVLPPETNLPYGIFDVRGYDGMETIPFTNLEARLGDVKMINNIQIFQSYDSPALNLMNVKYVILQTGMQAEGVSPPRFVLVYADSAVDIYENLQYLPRAFLVYNYTVTTNETDAMIRVSNGLIEYNRSVILGPLLSDEPLPMVGMGHGNVSSVSYGVNDVKVEVSTTDNCLLFISDAYFPGWEVFVDNTRSSLYRADYAFMAVAIPTGVHKIEFLYAPLSLTFGAYATLSAASMILIILLWDSRRSRIKRSSSSKTRTSAGRGMRITGRTERRPCQKASR